MITLIKPEPGGHFTSQLTRFGLQI
jgi:hypothetical protein